MTNGGSPAGDSLPVNAITPKSGSAQAIKRSPVVRAFWFCIGWVCVGLGGLGVILPGLPATGFFVFAAACFSRSSPRFEQWILDLPKVGPLVQDYRAGLGMSKPLKIRATAMMWISISLSVGFAIEPWIIKMVVVLSGLVGSWFIWVRTPTRVDTERSASVESLDHQ